MVHKHAMKHQSQHQASQALKETGIGWLKPYLSLRHSDLLSAENASSKWETQTTFLPCWYRMKELSGVVPERWRLQVWLWGAYSLLFYTFLALFVSTLIKEVLSHSVACVYSNILPAYLIFKFCASLRIERAHALWAELLLMDILSPPYLKVL